jgi:hypothetical protein
MLRSRPCERDSRVTRRRWAMGDEYDAGTPTLQVNVFQHGRLVAQVTCESADDAADVVAQWEDEEAVECELEDLAAHHRGDDVLAPEPEDVIADAEYRASGS